MDAIFDRSGGNAYLVEELAGAVDGRRRPGRPAAVAADVLLSRVDALSPDAQRLLRTASVAGRAVPDRLLAEVAGLGETELFAGVREAVENHLLVVAPDGQGYSFRHALTRDAVYEDMLPGERVRLHAAYGAALARDPGLAGRARRRLPAALAYHWYAALDLPRALPASVDAASARHGLATRPAEALRHLERALEIWPRVDRRAAAHRPGPGGGERAGRARPPTGPARSTGRGRCSPTPWPSCPTGADPVRRALLLERYALVAAGRRAATDAAVASLRAGAGDCCRRARRPGRTRWCWPRWPAALMRSDDMERCAEVASSAIAAARAAGARDAEADARDHARLGQVATSGQAGGRPRCRCAPGVRLALELGLPTRHRAARLHQPVRRAGAAGPARRGRAGRRPTGSSSRCGPAGPHARLVPDRQPGRAAAAAGPLGRGRPADRARR